jgi:hypothetical protein
MFEFLLCFYFTFYYTYLKLIGTTSTPTLQVCVINILLVLYAGNWGGLQWHDVYITFCEN